jgi:hypothetical protein
MTIKSNIHNIQNTFFDIFIYISYILIFISAIGFSEKAPEYIAILDYYLKIYICLFLIWRFNPLRSHIEFTDLDRKISFSAGLFILTTTTLNQYMVDIKNFMKSYIL